MKHKKAELKPDEKACLDLRGLYEQYGYKKYKMGKFEEYSLYVENKDFLAGGDKVITFTDLDGRLLALKPDVTLSIIKNTTATKEHSEKLYYIENVYRESRESHTFQEVSQMGLEYLGEVDRYAITEVIALAAKSLKDIDENYILSVSHMDFAIGFLESLDLSENLKLKILRSIRNKNVDGIKKLTDGTTLSKEQVEGLCKLPRLHGTVLRTIKQAKALAVNEKMHHALRELEDIYNALKAFGVTKNVQLDFSMVNDIDYYNGIIFRGYIQSLGRSVLSGGQYDQAMALLGKQVEAIGFGLYLNDINRITAERPDFDIDAGVLYGEEEDICAVIAAVRGLQSEGLSVRAGKAMPDHLRCRELYRVENGQLIKEVSSC